MKNTDQLAGILEVYRDDIKALLNASISPATRKALLADLRQYQSWEHHSLPATPETIAAYIVHLNRAGRKKTTIRRAISSLSKIHSTKAWPNPCDSELVRTVLKGLARTKTEPAKKARALLGRDIIKIVKSLGPSHVDRRNAALIALGWLAALRSGEIAALRLSDVDPLAEGITVKIERSKTDQDGAGALLAIPSSPLTDLVLKWREMALELYETGPLFPRLGKYEKWHPKPGERSPLSTRSISLTVKAAVSLAGLNPSHYSPHSLRSGLCTQAAKVGVPERIIQRHSRHASLAVLRGYVQEGDMWIENPLPAILDTLFRGNKNL